MGERVPIRVAKEIAKANGFKQVILCAWDGERTHIVTYGTTVNDCEQAATGGNKIKAALGWPKLNAEPSRVKALRRELEAGRAPLRPEIREALEAGADALSRRSEDKAREANAMEFGADAAHDLFCESRDIAQHAATLRSFLSVSTEPEILSLTGDERGRLKEVRAALQIVLGTARNASGISPEEEQAIRVLEPLVAVSQEGLK